MVSGKHKIAVDPEMTLNVSSETEQAECHPSAETDDSGDHDEEPRRGAVWLAPLSAAALMLGWTALFAASNWAAMRSGASLAGPGR